MLRKTIVMKAVGFVMLLCAAPSIAQDDIMRFPLVDGRERPNEGPGLYVQRPTIIVSDLDRALTLWRDVLGFSVDGIGPLSGPESMTAMRVWNAPSEATFRFATLSIPGRQQRTIGLGEMKGADIEVPESPRIAAILLQVEDLHEKVDQIVAMGLSKHYESSYGPNAEGLMIGEVGFLDHDGHLIVMFEENPAQP